MKRQELIDAIKINGLEEINKFIEIGGNVNERINDIGWTLLHLAVDFENLQIIKLLIENGADIEIRDFNGWTPLHTAVDVDIDIIVQSFNNVHDIETLNIPFETTSLLIKLGANLNAKNNNGETPRDIALNYGELALKNFDELISRIT